MELPFSEREFLEVFAQYNETLGAGALLLWCVAALLVSVWLVRPQKVPDRLIAGFLAALSLWTGIAYHLLYFARVNPAARGFAFLFIVQAFLLAWLGVYRRRIRFKAPTERWLAVSATLLVYALMYPLLVLATGFEYPRMPTFGVPCPTTLLMTGFLVAASPPVSRKLLVVPILWGIIGGSAALLFKVYSDWALIVSVIVLLSHMAMRRGGDFHQAAA